MIRAMASQKKMMDRLKDHLNSLSTDDQAAFAERCKTTVGFLRKAISIEQDINLETVMLIQRESKGSVRVEHLRPDVDWQILRREIA